MKTAIKIPGRTPITSLHLKPLVDAIKTLPEKWDFGNVNTCIPPDWVTASFEDTLSRLNTLGHQYKIFESSPSRMFSTGGQLLFGRGSVGTHNDNINGLNILTFSGSFIPGDDADYFDRFDIPQFHHRDGQFFQGKFIDMHQGDSILFDDDENHAWISNAYWIFASMPVRRLPKPRPGIGVPSTKVQIEAPV